MQWIKNDASVWIIDKTKCGRTFLIGAWILAFELRGAGVKKMGAVIGWSHVISVVSEFTGESGAAKKIVMAQRQRQNDKNVSPDSCHKVLVSQPAL